MFHYVVCHLTVCMIVPTTTWCGSSHSFTVVVYMVYQFTPSLNVLAHTMSLYSYIYYIYAIYVIYYIVCHNIRYYSVF